MKTVGIISILSVALLTGCASTAPQTAKAPTQEQAEAQDDEEDNIIVPYFDSGPPGSMEMDWQPTAPPPEKKVKPRKLRARPDTLKKKKRLFALPAQSQAGP